MRHHATSYSTAIESKIRRSLPRLYAWYRKNRRPLPWRTRPTPYRTAVAEFMCQQTRIVTVIPYYQRWMRAFPNWSRLARSTPTRVLRMWEGLGYYRRARSLHSLAKAVLRLSGKDLPSETGALRSLPGIGDYTAGAIASIAFGQPSPAFDGNVARVLGRLAARRGRVPALPALRHLASRLVPRKNPGRHNQALMELGALVCLPKNPRCSDCSMRLVCSSASRPPLPLRSRSDPRHLKENIFVVVRKGKVWLIPEDPWGRWRGLWTLPSQRGRISAQAAFRWVYPYTRYIFKAGVVRTRRPPVGTRGKWWTVGQIRKLPLPIPHRHILKKLELS